MDLGYFAHLIRGQALLEELKTEFEERVAAEAAAKAEAVAATAEGEAAKGPSCLGTVVIYRYLLII